VVYYGMLRDDVKHRKVASEIETAVFRHWDGSNEAPPKVRPRPPASFAVDGLCLISSTAAGPVWPESLASKFPEKSAENVELDKMKQAFLKEFPNARTHSESTEPSTPTRGTVRVAGHPDFSNNHGPEPLDVSRIVDCLVVTPPVPDDRPKSVGSLLDRVVFVKDDLRFNFNISNQDFETTLFHNQKEQEKSCALRHCQ